MAGVMQASAEPLSVVEDVPVELSAPSRSLTLVLRSERPERRLFGFQIVQFFWIAIESNRKGLLEVNI